jgi:membrane protein DedA with SNARE-associated domain
VPLHRIDVDSVHRRLHMSPPPPVFSSRHPPSRRVLSAVVVPLIVMVVAANSAFFLWPSLVDTHPLLLLTLSAQNRYLALTTNNLDAWSYYLVGTLRLLAPDPLFYLLGLWYGVRAIEWMERRAPSVGASLRWVEKGFARARYVIVFVAPNNPVSLLAGAAAMPPAIFAVLNITGTITRLVLIRLLGNAFANPIDGFLGFVREYRWYVVGASVVFALLSNLSDRRRGGSQVEALRHLGDDLAGDDLAGDDLAGDDAAGDGGDGDGRRTGNDPEVG